MLIDIHRHSPDNVVSNRYIRNLFHSQVLEVIDGQMYSAGLHPWHVQEKTLNMDLQKIVSAADNLQIVAIGEAGLDKKIKTPFEVQLSAFEKQIEIAKEVNKPMIIHCVHAYNEIYELKNKSGHKKPWLIHWFNANRQIGLQLVKKGFYLSFGHMLFNENSKAFKAFPHIPIENIFFETDDAEFSIDEIYKRASELLSLPIASLEKRIEQNFEIFFGIKP